MEYETNAELIKELDEPESSKPLNGRTTSGNCRLMCSALESGVLAAPSFRSAPREMFRQLTPQGMGELRRHFLVELGRRYVPLRLLW